MVEYISILIMAIVLSLFVAITWILDHFLKRYLNKLVPDGYLSPESAGWLRRLLILVLSLGALYTLLLTVPPLRATVTDAWGHLGEYTKWIESAIYAAIGFGILYIIVKMVDRIFTKKVETAVERPDQRTAMRLIRRIINAVILIVGIIIIVSAVTRIDVGSVVGGVLVAGGALALVMGLALQSVLGNIFSGISIVLSKPYRIGDAVIIKNEYGNIEDITLRHTVMKTWDNRRIILPNTAMANEEIINYTLNDPRMICQVCVDISYESDVDRAMEIMVQEAKKHPTCLPDMEPGVAILGFKDSGVQLRALLMTRDQPTAFRTACDLRKAIKKRFEEAGIDIPYPRRYVIMGSEKKHNKKEGRAG